MIQAARAGRRGSRLWWMVCLLLGVLQLPNALRADEAEDYNLAVRLFKQAKWSSASKQFEDFIKKYPEHERVPLAKFYLGLAYVNQDEYKLAHKLLKEFVQAQPANTNIAQARYRIAECSYLLNDLPAALPELKEFVEKHPQDPLLDRALPYLGDVQLRQGQAEAALATFDKVLKDHPQSSQIDDAKFGRAKSLEQLKRDGEAIKQYQELVADPKSPRAAEALFQLAGRQFELQRFAEATAAYLDLLQKFPKSSLAAAARLNAGYGLWEQGKYAEAAQQFAAAQKDQQNSVTAGYWRGLSLKAIGEVKQAATVLADAAKEADKDHPLADAIQFQRGTCARQQNDAAAALEFFKQGADLWPKGDYADDSLHAAAELALDSGDIAQATTLLTKFAAEYPGSGLRLHYDLLMGRVDLMNASAEVKAGKPAAESYRLAGERFDKVLRDSTVPRTQMLARYYLGLTRQLQNQHEEAIKALGPLVAAVVADDGKSEFGEALLVQAESQLALKQYDAAQAAAEKYLSLYPKGRQQPRAWFVIAVAAGNRDENATSTAALDRLIKDYPKHSLTPVALLQLAEIAETKQDWPTSAARFSALAKISDGTDNQAFAIRGLAWSLFKQKQFGPAAEQFSKVVKQFPNHKLNSECSYYYADSLREAGQKEPAAAAYAVTFEKFSPKEPAAPNSEDKAPLLFAYRAGLQRARTLRQLKQIPQADQAYAALMEKFPRPQQHDKLLDEWALMNYESERYEQADKIFQRLIIEAPNSDLADNAELSLAESNLLAEKHDQAKQTFENLLQSDRSDAEVKERSLYQLIVLAVDELRWDDVRKLSDRLSREFPSSPHLGYAQYSEAEAILSMPPDEIDGAQLKAAKQRLEAVMKSAPSDGDSFHGRAWVLMAEIAFREKDYAEVDRLAEELKQKSPDSVFIYQMNEIVGRSYKQQADFPKARAALQSVLDNKLAFRTQTAAKSRFLIAETYFLEEKWEEAFLDYLKVVDSYDFPEWQSAALLQSGKCEEQLKRWKDAVTTYEELIRKYPDSEHAAEAKKRLEAAKARAQK